MRFPANNDSTTQVTREFAVAFAAQHVRFHPTDFAGHMSMRVGVQGCALQSEGFVCDCEEGWRNVDPFSLATSCGSKLCSTQFTSGATTEELAWTSSTLRTTRSANPAVDVSSCIATALNADDLGS